MVKSHFSFNKLQIVKLHCTLLVRVVQRSFGSMLKTECKHYEEQNPQQRQQYRVNEILKERMKNILAYKKTNKNHFFPYKFIASKSL